MADVITRFKLETTQFDSKLRDSAKSVADLTSKLMMAGKDFDRFADKNVEAAKALGSIAPSANNAKDKVKELVSAYNDAAKAYNMLTEEQKNSDYGKALSSSLEQLKGKVTEAKQELYGLGKSLGDAGRQSQQTGGFMDELAKRFTINIDVMKLFNVGLQAAETALNVAKDAFFKSEDNIDEWGRTVEGAKGAYDYFLDALNTGNWSNFFDNLETAINGSRDLYDALDRLGSVKANNQAAIALVQAEIQQLRLLKSQGKDVDEQIKNATKRLRDLQMGSVNAGKDAGRSSMQNVLRNSINAMGGGVNDVNINNAVNKILKEGQSAFDHFRKVAERFEKYSGAQSVRNVMAYSPTGLAYKVGEEKYFDITKLTPAQQRAYKIAKSVTMQETPLQQGIGIYAQAAGEETAANREEFRGNRYALQRPGGGGGTGGKPEVWAPIAMQDVGMVGLWSIADADAAIKRQKGKLANAGSWGERMDAQTEIAKLEREKAFMLPNTNPFQEAFKHNFTKDLKSRDKDEKQEEDKSEKTDAKVLEEAGKMVQGMQAITSGVEQLGIDLPSSIQNVTNGITSIISIISGIATILTAIQTIQTAQTFKFWSRGGVVHAAGGMVVPGNHFSGDLIPSMIQSGEVVLNKAQAGVLAHELDGPKNNAMRLETYVSGRDLKIVLNNDSEARGQGRFVTKVGG